MNKSKVVVHFNLQEKIVFKMYPMVPGMLSLMFEKKGMHVEIKLHACAAVCAF